MSDVSGIPNLGIPAMGGFNQGGFFAAPGAGLANAQASQASNNRYFQNQAATLSAAHMPQSQLYGGGSFGAQPAYYAGLGAAYGRATGGFKPPAAASVFQTGAAPFQSYGLPGGGGLGAFSPSTNYPGGRDAIARSMMQGGGGASFADRFGAAPPINSFLQSPSYQSALDAVNQFNGRGTGVGANIPKLPASPPPTASEGGEGSFAGRFGAAPTYNPSSFANRFGAGNYFQPGTPSQYYTGSQYPNAQAPPRGYETLFGADNPRGALPVGGFGLRGR
jgi:hypothetical protein